MLFCFIQLLGFASNASTMRQIHFCLNIRITPRMAQFWIVAGAQRPTPASGAVVAQKLPLLTGKQSVAFGCGPKKCACRLQRQKVSLRTYPAQQCADLAVGLPEQAFRCFGSAPAVWGKVAKTFAHRQFEICVRVCRSA